MIDEYLRLWKDDSPPDLDDFLHNHPAMEPDLVVDLIRFDLRKRWPTGQRLQSEDYLFRYDFLRSNDEYKLDLVFTEYLLREKHADPLDVDQFVSRFPEIAQPLRAQIELHRLTASVQDSLTLIDSLQAHDTPSAALGATIGLENSKPTATTPPPSSAVSADARASVSEAPVRARQFGDYELLEEIARGGMGIVYRARQLSVNRIVAVKVIKRSEYANETDRLRFQAEANAAANLEHANIVPIYDVGETDGKPYFSMRLIEGGSLADSISQGHWPYLEPATLKRAAELVAVVAQAVHAAHRYGILHRDLKPANILLDQSGTPFVTDFGLAKRVNGPDDPQATELTQTGAIIGTPAFMAPEQASGKKGLTTSADIYSLGAVLYTLLTGRTPFQAESHAEMLVQVLHGQLPSLRKLNRLIDLDLETICQKCLEREPDRRYTSAKALGEDLQRWLEDRPILARPISTGERLTRWCRRNPIITGLLTGILILICTGITMSVLFLVRLNQAKYDALESADRAQNSFRNEVEARKKESAALVETQRQLVKADLANSQLHSYRGAHREALHWLVKAWTDDSKTSQFSQQRENDHRLRVAAQIEKLPNLQGICFHNTAVVSADLSPDGRFVVSLTGDRTVHVWSVETSEQMLAPLEHESRVKHAIFSPDGRSIATITEQGVHLWDLSSGKSRMQQFFDESPACVLFNSRSERLWVATGQVIVQYDLHTLTRTNFNVDVGSIILTLGLSPDDSRLVASMANDIAQVFDSATGESQSEPIPQEKFAEEAHWEIDEQLFEQRRQALSFSPDSQHLVTTDGESLFVWNSDETVKSIPLFDGSKTVQIQVSFTGDGKKLLVAYRPGASIDCYDLATDTWEATYQQLPRQPAAVVQAADTSVGAVAVTGGTIYFFALPLRQLISSPVALGKSISSMKFSRDGRRLMAASLDGTVRIWATPKLESRLTYQYDCGHADRILLGDNRFSPDGTLQARPVSLGVELQSMTNPLERWTLMHEQAVPYRISSDGRWLVSANESTAIVWDLQTRQPQLTIPLDGQSISELAFSDQNERLALRLASPQDPTNEFLWVWDLKQKRAWLGPESVKRKAATHLAPLVMNRTGTCLAVPEDSDIVHLLDVQSGQRLPSINAKRSAWIFGLGFEPDDEALAVAFSDLSLRQYNFRTATPARPQIQLSEVAASAADYSDDGLWLLTCTTVNAEPIACIYTARECELLAMLGPLPLNNEQERMEFGGVYTRLWLTTDRKRLIVHAPRFFVTQWQLPTFTASLEDLMYLSQLLTNIEMDDAGNLWSIDPDHWLSNQAIYRRAWKAWKN